MHCERARAVLFERLDRTPDEAAAMELEAHLSSCAECAALQHDLQGLEAQVRVWHELSPPAWNPAPVGSTLMAPGRGGSGAAGARAGLSALLQQWLPLVASSAALALAVALFWRGAATTEAPSAASAAAATGAVPVAELLAASRQERQEEMEALTALLKAEMDRRSLETEESLKYIITHQIQSQRELDAIRSRLPDSQAQSAEQL